MSDDRTTPVSGRPVGKPRPGLPVVPGYELIKELGRGGTGVVYRATDLALGREVAIKLLHEQYATDSEVARRFTHEAQITARLQHPGIPPVHALGTLPDGRPYMPPEQAAGTITVVDERSDVLGLGAVLAVILTGQPSFAAESPEAARAKSARGDLAACLARLNACDAEGELVALCRRCLSASPADHPADAREVAHAVAACPQSQTRICPCASGVSLGRAAGVDAVSPHQSRSEPTTARVCVLGRATGVILSLIKTGR